MFPNRSSTMVTFCQVLAFDKQDDPVGKGGGIQYHLMMGNSHDALSKEV